MNFSRNLFITLAVYLLSLVSGENLVCVYDASSPVKEGVPKFTTTDLEKALEYCTHITFGYATITDDTFTVKSRNYYQSTNFFDVQELKEKYPHVKFLLGIGGDKDLKISDKYFQLLEGGSGKHRAFASSAGELMRMYKFDGLDLALPLPHQQPVKEVAFYLKIYNWFRKFWTSTPITPSPESQFTSLIQAVKTEMALDNNLLTMTVLPNANLNLYFNIRALSKSLDFVNLGTFDFITPENEPYIADYTAPLYPPPSNSNRKPQHNIDFQVNYWISHHFSKNKINVGIASYGRAWEMTSDLNNKTLPLLYSTNGPAAPGPQTQTQGLLTWSEICLKLLNFTDVAEGTVTSLQVIPNLNTKYGSCALRPADKQENGIFVSYENPDTAAGKAIYVKTNVLGGVALFNLNSDDFLGQCDGTIFPMLRAIKDKLI